MSYKNYVYLSSSAVPETPQSLKDEMGFLSC